MSLSTIGKSAVRAGLKPTHQRAIRCLATSQTRTKVTLPDLPYDYAALEPAISGEIMELHHSKHHQTYVTSLNNFTTQLGELTSSSSASSPASIAKQIALQPMINFHGGGHLNHSLFWENLAPKSSGGGDVAKGGAAVKEIEKTWGSVDAFKGKMNEALAGVQGSGWAWLVRDKGTGVLSIVTRNAQDPVVGAFAPLLGVDAWEHAYYLQYQNRKADYFKAIWDVVNWETVGKRFDAAK